MSFVFCLPIITIIPKERPGPSTAHLISSEKEEEEEEEEEEMDRRAHARCWKQPLCEKNNDTRATTTATKELIKYKKEKKTSEKPS